MRFEIRAGGGILILAGLLGLSGAVFSLGLIAGYEMARQNTADSAQVASVFPVPTPPALEPTPTAAAPLAEGSPAAMPSVASIVPATRPRSFAADKSSEPAARKSPSVGAPEPAHPMAAASPRMVANAEPSPALRRHPYNIQIDAVMDRAGADDMVRRLKALGFPSTAAATSMNGQTWYRVSVGPYATQDEAMAAQEKLHQQYRATYNGH
ncbi:MAG: SPOR domain-containing protein [Candidatus Binataceae bacterium]